MSKKKKSPKIVEGIEGIQISERSSFSYVKQFIPYYRPYLGYLLVDLLCALLATGVEIIFPMLVGSITDSAVISAGLVFEQTLKVGGILVVLKLVEICSRFFINKYGHIMGARIETDLRRNLFRHLQAMPHKYYDNAKVGTLMSRLTSDLFDITEFSHHCPEELFIALVKILGIFTILFLLYNPILTLVIFAMLPFMIWFSVSYNNKWDANYKAHRVQMGEINAQAEDTLSGIRVVKSFANEAVEQDKFEKGNVKFLNVKKQSYHYMGTFNAGIITMNSIMYITIIVLGGFLGISAGEFVVYLLFATSLLASVVRLADYTEQFNRGITAYARYQEVMDAPVEVEDKPNAILLEVKSGDVEFKDVTFRYNEDTVNVLKDFSLKIHKGEVIAIVGSSGAGKTTIANLIPRFYEVNSGSITIDGHDIRDVTLSSLRSNIGVVAQDVYMFYGTVADNIAYGKINASMEEIINAARLAGADEFINKLPNGYDSIVGERGVKLSGGQKQRLSIARVFLKNPPILILDEATSSLDNASEVQVQKSLDILSKGRTSIVIAHRLSTIRNATNIIVLSEEGIIESGTHRQLMELNGEYAKLYALSLARTEISE